MKEKMGEPNDPREHPICVRDRGELMKLPEYAPAAADRVSTREELFQVLELLGGFEEIEGAEPSPACELFTCLDSEPTVSPAEILDQVTTREERLLLEIEPFSSLLDRKAERIN